MKYSTAVAAVILGCASAHADLVKIEKEIAGCAAVSGNLDRLSCFDRVAAERGLSGPQPQPIDTTDTGKWRLQRDRNPIDDSVRVVAALQADSGKSRFGQPITFFARCQSNETEVFIVWNDYVGDDSSDVYSDWKRVTLRIGQQPARVERWGVSTDHKATFAPDWPGKLLKDMLAADSFLAQLTPYGESPVTASFDTRGLRNALKPLSEACGWAP